MKRIKKLCIALNIVVVLILLCAYLSPFINPKHLSFPAMVSLLYPYFFVANILFVLLWIFLRQKYFLFSLIILLVGWNLHGRFIQFSVDQPQLNTEQHSLKCMTYNIRWLHHVPPADQTLLDEKIHNLSSRIKGQAPNLDILCLEEGALGEKLGKRLGLKHAIKADKISIWLLSRFPVIKHGTLYTDNQDHGFGIWADIKLPDGTIRVFGLHLQSNHITTETEELMEEIRIQERATWIQMKDILSKYRKATVIRSEQASILRDEINKSPHPVLVIGDLNDTPYSRSYQIISEKLKDSFLAAGKGIGTTYAGQLPALRIDYIFCDSFFEVKNHEVLDWDYSDHFPVIAELQY